MIGDILQPTHLLFVLVVALLVLGPKRLPEMARTLGSGMRDFKAAISGEERDDESHTNQVVGETAPPATQAAATYTLDGEYSADPAYSQEPELPYSHEPVLPTSDGPVLPSSDEPVLPSADEPALPLAHKPALPYSHAPRPTYVREPVPEPEPTHEPSAQPSEATQVPAPEHQATPGAGSPEPTEIHAPAGSQPDSA